MHYPNGSIFVGTWKANKQNGNGITKLASGEEQQSCWHNGKPVTLKDDMVSEGAFSTIYS